MPAVLYLFVVATIVTAIVILQQDAAREKPDSHGFTYDAQIQRYVKMAYFFISDSNEIVQKDKKFMRGTCSNCLKGHPCSGQFSAETVLYNLYNCLELSSSELDLQVLSNIHVFTKTEKKSATKGIEVLDAASLIKQFQSARRCSYIFTELAIPYFED